MRQTMNERRCIQVEGLVQGVGFRPFVYTLAANCGLGGFVLNEGGGVVIELEGERHALDSFVSELRKQAPRHAVIDKIVSRPVAPRGQAVFAIARSLEQDER